jgi:hypothetical protein
MLTATVLGQQAGQTVSAESAASYSSTVILRQHCCSSSSITSSDNALLTTDALCSSYREQTAEQATHNAAAQCLLSSLV